MNRIDRLFSQLKYMVDYEYKHYQTKELLVSDLKRILNDEVVFVNVGMDKIDMNIDLFFKYNHKLDILRAFLKEKTTECIDVLDLDFIQTRDKILELFDYDYECLSYELEIFEREVNNNGNKK